MEATKSAILPELVELANDEESYVQLAGIETVVSMLSLLDDGLYISLLDRCLLLPSLGKYNIFVLVVLKVDICSAFYLYHTETCTQIIVPLVKKFCENSMKSGDLTLPVVAKQLGKLCHGLSGELHNSQG